MYKRKNTKSLFKILPKKELSSSKVELKDPYVQRKIFKLEHILIEARAEAYMP